MFSYVDTSLLHSLHSPPCSNNRHYAFTFFSLSSSKPAGGKSSDLLRRFLPLPLPHPSFSSSTCCALLLFSTAQHRLNASVSLPHTPPSSFLRFVECTSPSSTISA
jgi:hypothetical protein